MHLFIVTSLLFEFWSRKDHSSQGYNLSIFITFLPQMTSSIIMVIRLKIIHAAAVHIVSNLAKQRKPQRSQFSWLTDRLLTVVVLLQTQNWAIASFQSQPCTWLLLLVFCILVM